MVCVKDFIPVCVLFVTISSEIIERKVYAYEGDEKTLPCPGKLSCEIKSRDDNSDRDRMHQNESPCELKITNIQPSDSSIYECVDSEKLSNGQWLNGQAVKIYRLYVTEVYLEIDSKKVTGHINFDQEVSKEIKCIAKEAKKKPTGCKWSVGGKTIPSENNCTIKSGIDKTKEIHYSSLNYTRDPKDNGETLRCELFYSSSDEAHNLDPGILSVLIF